MKRLLIVLSSLLLFSISTAFADGLKVGVVDLTHILQQSSQVAAINKNLQAEFAPQRQKIMEAQKKISVAAKKLVPSESKKLSAKQRKKIQDKIAIQQKSLQKMMFGFQEKLSTAQEKAMTKFIDKVDNTVKSIAKKDKLDLVLLKPAVIYSKNTVDVTKEVISQLPKK